MFLEVNMIIGQKKLHFLTSLSHSSSPLQFTKARVVVNGICIGQYMDESRIVARHMACALSVLVMKRNPDLLEELVRGKEEGKGEKKRKLGEEGRG